MQVPVLEPHSTALSDLLPEPRETRAGRGFVSFTSMSIEADPDGESARRRLAQCAGLDGDSGDLPVLRVVVGSAPGSDAWRLAAQARLSPEDLPRQGYALLVDECDAEPCAVVAGADATGAYYGAGTLLEMVAGTRPRVLPRVALRDWPSLGFRGVVEGFYGPAWTHEDRLEYLRFAGRCRLNAFVYAPKDDPYHRERWRDPYPAEELARLSEVVEQAAREHVRFVYALAPGLSMRYSDPADLDLLLAKADQLWGAGVREFALLFDDIPVDLAHDVDVAEFGDAPGAAASAHARVSAAFAAWLAAHGRRAAPLSMCPTDYAGTASTPYRERLARELPDDVLVWWTGRDVVVGEVTRQDVDDAAASYGHRLLLWDNFPVNDFDRSRLFLGPLTGRPRDVAGSALVGVAANPMIEAAPSHLALATVGEYAWNPETYDPRDAARRALTAVAGEDAEALAPLVEACSAWPPSAPQSPELDAAMTAALRGDSLAAESLLSTFALLAAAGQWRAEHGGRLAEQLGPWLDAAASAARAGELAVRLLLAARSAMEVGSLPEDVARAVDDAETHAANVLRSHVPGFARRVLEMTESVGRE